MPTPQRSTSPVNSSSIPVGDETDPNEKSHHHLARIVEMVADQLARGVGARRHLPEGRQRRTGTRQLRREIADDTLLRFTVRSHRHPPARPAECSQAFATRQVLSARGPGRAVAGAGDPARQTRRRRDFQKRPTELYSEDARGVVTAPADCAISAPTLPRAWRNGRREGLKHLCPKDVWVRVPPPAPSRPRGPVPPALQAFVPPRGMPALGWRADGVRRASVATLPNQEEPLTNGQAGQPNARKAGRTGSP